VKLRPRFTLIFVLYAAALLGGFSLLAYDSGRRSLLSATIAELQAAAIEKEAALNEWIEGHRRGIALLAADPTIVESADALTAAASGSPSALAAHDRFVAELQPWVAGGEFLDVIFIEPVTGKIIAASDPGEEGKFKEDRQFFIQGKSGPYVQNIYFSISLGGPAMTASAPLHAPDGRLLGVLAGHLNLEQMNTIINRRTSLRQTDDAFLVNKSNLFVTQPRFVTDPAVLQLGVHTEAVQRCLKHNSDVVEARDYRNVPAVVAYRWLHERELCLIVKMDQAEAYAPVRAFGKTVAVISGLALLVSAILAVELARSLTRPILALQDGAVRFGREELDVKLPENSRDELGALAHEFNKMAESLLEKDVELRAYAGTLEQKVRERTEELQESHSRLSRAEQVGLIGSWEWNIPENRVAWSDGLYKVFGLSAQEFGATYEAYLERIHPQEREFVQGSIGRALQERGTFEYESRIIRADKQIRFIFTRGEVLLDTRGEPVRMIGVALDTTERQQALDALRESEDKFKYIFDYSVVGKSITDPDGGITVNKSFCAILGYTEQELIHKKWQEITHPEDIELSRRAIESLLSGEEDSTRFIKRYLHKDGSVVWTDVSTSLRRDEEGKPVYFMTSLLDITERIQSEEELRRSEARYRSLFENMLSGYAQCQMLFDENDEPSDFIYLNVNDAFEKLTGLKGVVGKKVSEVIPGVQESNPELIETYGRVAKTGNPETFETDIPSLGIWFSISVYSPKQDYFVAVFDNITERKHADIALKQSEERYRTLIEQAGDGIFISDATGRYIDVNSAGLTMLGYSREELLQMNLNDLIPSEDKGKKPPRLDEIRAGKTVITERRLICKDGSLLPVEISGKMLADGRLQGIVRDITERRKAEEALRLENERFMRFVNSNIVGIVIAETNGRITLANDYYLNILGVRYQDFIDGKVDWRKFTPPEWLIADEKALRELSERGICEPYEKEYVREDGTRVPVYIADAMLPGPDEQIAAFVLDITDRKRAEDAVQRIAEDLRRSNAELERFAYVASHDLQEPLRMITSYLQLLEQRYKDKLDGDALEYIDYAVDGSSRMKTLIADLLAYSRVGTRGKEFSLVECEAVLTDVLRNLKILINDSKAKITHDPLPRVIADDGQLASLFQNLIGNAIKFRGENPPEIHIGLKQEGGNWVFSIKDNGIGIDPQYFDRVFIIFQRLHTRKKYSGTGIGLAISKRIVERHGGRIWIESQPGSGSTFYFTIPIIKGELSEKHR
jgi:PAS domain S-box-containing protein